MQKYKIGKRISDGAFGTVYQAQLINQKSQSTSRIAIKQVYSSSQHLPRQLSILSQLPKHHNIIEVHQTFSQNFMTHIVMQRGRYDLSHWINLQHYPIPQYYVKNIAYQLLRGIAVVHEVGFIHRDLKPSNVVLRDNGQLALCDFGSAVKCTKGEEYQLQGFTRWYKCPEMLFGERRYKYQADIWSVGCIIMEAATGYPLFTGKSQIEQLALIAQFLGDPSPKNWPGVINMPDYNKINFKTITPKCSKQIAQEWNITHQLSQFILKMLRYQGRLSAKELLQDQFFRNMKIIEDIGQEAPVMKIHRQLLQKAKKDKMY